MNSIDPLGQMKLLTALMVVAIIVIVLLAILFVPSLIMARYTHDWGVKKGVKDKKNIVLIDGTAWWEKAWDSWWLLSIARLREQLRSAGHNVDYRTSVTEEELAGILSTGKLVAVYGHGPIDRLDASGKPMGFLVLGGTNSIPADNWRYYPSLAGATNTAPAEWITANELSGLVTPNTNLEFVVAACNSAKTDRFYSSSGGTNTRMYIGTTTKTVTHQNMNVLQYIVERANGKSTLEAEAAVTGKYPYVTSNPSRPTF